MRRKMSKRGRKITISIRYETEEEYETKRTFQLPSLYFKLKREQSKNNEEKKWKK
jgi:hypothetical protein